MDLTKKKQSKEEEEKQQEQLHKQLLIQDNNPVLIEADKVRIMQVIDNLISNALKFTKEGTISLSVESKDCQAIIP